MVTRSIDLDGPVHYMDFGGSGPTMVLVHGLGGAHLNWMDVGAKLARRARVVALDLAGFGLTPLAGRSASVHANQALLDRFIQALSPSEPVILVGNSMGGAISVLQTARQPQRVSGLVLVDPAQPRAEGAGVDKAVLGMFALYAIPGVGELYVKRRAAKYGPEKLTRGMLKLCSADFNRLSEELVRMHVELSIERHARMPWSDKAFVEAARSLLLLMARKGRYRSMTRSITVPTLLIQGTEDRLVAVANSRELAGTRPDWTYVELAGIGHVPMMECPDVFVSAVDRWLDGPASAALGGARVAQAS